MNSIVTPSILNSIPEAIEDIQAGKIVIVVDDENRENEGDFLAAAALVTPEIINFMSTYGRGLICTPLPESRCDELDLALMVKNTTDPNETAFTVSIDLIGDGVTTGISASDRAKTIQALMNENITSKNFARPGHIFPLRAKEGGVLKRAGHTEAAIDLATLAGLKAGGVIVEIMNEDGTMARLPDLLKIAQKHQIKIISIKDLIAYRLQYDSLVEIIDEFEVKTIYGSYTFVTFKEKTNEQLHFVLKKGNWNIEDSVLVRVQSSNTYYDIFSSLVKGEVPLLKPITDMINAEGKGAIIFINNVSDSESILSRISHFKNYSEGKDKKPVPPVDSRDYGIGSQIIKQLGIQNIKLITHSPNYEFDLDAYKLSVVEKIAL